MKVIINADDFGYSEDINRAVGEAFTKGYITNTTIMVNMDGTEHAVSLARERGFIDRVGLHLNLFEGIPLTDAMKSNSFFSQNGEMTSYKMFHELSSFYKFFLPLRTNGTVLNEITAQMKRYNELGLTEKHLDSHGHSHTFFSVYRLIVRANRNFENRTLRLSLNMFIKRKFIVKIYKKLFNCMIRHKFCATDYFTSAAEFIEVAKTMKQENGKIVWRPKYQSSTCELMVHPAYDETGKLINKGGPSFEELFCWLDGVSLISYRDL